jgi:hypothetical protein
MSSIAMNNYHENSGLIGSKPFSMIYNAVMETAKGFCSQGA